MADLEITSTGAPGWRELRVGSVRGLLPEDLPDAVAEEIRAVEGSDEDSVTLEDVLDALVGAGIRRAPDAVLAQGRRIVVRGACIARLTGEDGDEIGTVTHDGRGPWVEVDIDPDAHAVELLASASATASVSQGQGLRLVDEWQPPSVLGEVAITRVPGPQPETAAPVEPDEVGPESSDEAVASAEPDEAAAGSSDDEVAPAEADEPETAPDGPADPQPEPGPAEPEAAAPSPPASTDVPDETGVPDYDFLFGDTQAARPGAVEPAGQDPSAAPMTADAVDAAAGVTRGEEPGGETILPTDEPEEEQVEPDRAPSAPPAQEAAAPSAPPTAGAGGLISAVPWARSGAGPAAAPSGPPPPAPSVQPEPGPAPRPAAPSVAPAAPAGAPPQVPPPPASPPSPAPSASSPAVPPPPAVAAPPEGDQADVTQGRDALIAQAASVDGPKVLAVICPAGHLSPPHRDTCRVCSRQIADQQAFEAARPVLGVLRLESGDKVPLDRGILLGRAPKAKADLDNARQPHVVKLPSPDNDLSRNHLEIVIDGWHVLARDLGSTNGTTVQLPGSAPTRLRPDEHVALEPGSILVLADVVSVTYEVGP